MQELGESGFDLGEVEVEKRTWRDDPCDFQADAPALVELLDFKTPLRSLFSKTNAAVMGEFASFPEVWISSRGRSKYRFVEESPSSLLLFLGSATMVEEAQDPHSNLSGETDLEITMLFCVGSAGDG